MTWSRTWCPAARSCSTRRSRKDEIWAQLPTPVQQALIDKKAKFYVIDATKVARDSGMGGRINTIMQVCFFALSGVLPQGRGDRGDQVFHQEDLRQEGRGNRRR